MPTITRKLYPPTIGNRIPAFYQALEDNSLIISVPFVNNRSVARADISTFALKLKTITNDYRTINGYTYVEEGQSLDDAVTEAWNTGIVKILIEADQYQTEDGWYLNIGQYYKIQLAYVATFTPEGEEPTPEEYAENVGYYSAVGISKFSWYPTVYIDNLIEGEDNYHTYQYFGRYSQTTQDGEIADSTEKVYKYRFIIENEDDGFIKDSGWLLHDSSTNESEYESYDSWEYLNELPESENDYTIQQMVETNSGIAAESPKQSLIDETDTQDFATFTMNYDFDNAYVALVCDSTTINECYWVRTNVNTGERIKIGKVTVNEVFRDFTTEQGESYKYSIFGNNTFTNPSEPIKIDYEDIFLFDGARQLKVRFNPSMSGIHETIMENKTDTIGGRYPFFFRNGDVCYRDFTLGGLISFHMDEQRLFSIYGVEDQPTRGRTYSPMPDGVTDFSLSTDLTGKNFTHERKFREEVLKWLNNGEIKLFRSPSEGIMLVRLMGCSMTPDKTTSRMIYSFSCQAYEAAGHEYEDLLKYKIYNLS